MMMKYARLAWLTGQGLALICAVGFGLTALKQQLTDAMPEFLFVVLLCGGMGGAYGFTAQRVLKEIRSIKSEGERR